MKISVLSLQLKFTAWDEIQKSRSDVWYDSNLLGFTFSHRQNSNLYIHVEGHPTLGTLEVSRFGSKSVNNTKLKFHRFAHHSVL